MLDMPNAEFTDAQKRYLEGFMSGLQVGRVGKGLGLSGAAPAPDSTAEPEPVGPDAAGFKAQNGFLRDGKKLSDPEKFKREQNPFDAYERLKQQASSNSPPPPADTARSQRRSKMAAFQKELTEVCKN